MLVDNLKTNLADLYALYIKAQNYHWNVEGPDFAQYHKFLGDLYESIGDEIDVVAELIRTMDEYAPGSFSRFSELTSIEDERSIRKSLEMFTILNMDNEKVLTNLRSTYEVAEQDKQYGISNQIQDIITAHEKHAWMLRSFLK
ncbi:MAG: DNA starvation/stationary phase protection protein [Caulobacteraceae bacterium]|nr:DNA starvation/stationary phase protection protein [Caulobacteraceae bacterium]